MLPCLSFSERFCLGFQRGRSPVECRRRTPADPPANFPEDPPILPIDSATEPNIHSGKRGGDFDGKTMRCNLHADRCYRKHLPANLINSLEKYHYHVEDRPPNHLAERPRRLASLFSACDAENTLPMAPYCGTPCAPSLVWSKISMTNFPTGCRDLPIAPVALAAACNRSNG